MLTPVRAEYERRRSDALALDARLDARGAWFGYSRVLVVFLLGVLLLRGYLGGTHAIAWEAALAALAVITLIPQAIVDRRRRRAQLVASHYARAMARLDGRWDAFESKGLRFLTPDHPYAKDLDLLGEGSLFQLLDTTRTAQGEATLAAWLLEPGTLDAVAKRREAVQELVPALDDREALALAGLDETLPRVDERTLLAWAEGAPTLALPRLEYAIACILPPITIAALFAYKYDVLPLWPILVLFAAEIGMLVRTRSRIAELTKLSERTEKALTTLLPLFVTASRIRGKSKEIAHIREALAGAVEATRSLKRRITFFQSRANLIVALVAPILLWDIHAAELLERWQRTRGRRLRQFFEALGALEALDAFATYADEHRDDAWPELVDGPLAYEADALGHPLLREDGCVRNDLRLSGPGTVLLVTGSNMSGKSTFLRSVGLSAVMALAGLPVRAKRLRASRLQVGTVMRVSDSLHEGASFFLAEVQRLKRIVDLTRGDLPVLFLLDEILQGTNTRERSLGARGVVRNLADGGAMGLVSTHDLSLVQLSDALGDRLTYAHFTDHVEGDRMTFDYRLREGVVQTSNALRLMRAVGLAVDVPEGSEPR